MISTRSCPVPYVRLVNVSHTYTVVLVDGCHREYADVQIDPGCSIAAVHMPAECDTLLHSVIFCCVAQEL